MFISTSHGKDCSVCCAIKRISYNPLSGIKISGEDAYYIQVTPTGDISTNVNNALEYIERCELPKWSFFKYNGKPIETGTINVREDSVDSVVTVQDLYHRLKRDLFSESNNRYVS